MSDILCIRVRQGALDDNSGLSWVVLTSAAKILASGTCRLADLWASVGEHQIEPGQIDKTVVIVPASAALLTEVDMPAQQRRHMRQALPFLIEEQIIDPIESMHLVTPVLVDGDRVPVIAIGRATLASWLDHLADIEVAPDYLFLDACCIPRQSGQLQIMQDFDQTLVRTGQHQGVSIASEMASSMVQLSIQSLVAQQSEQVFDDVLAEAPATPESQFAASESTSAGVLLIEPDDRDILEIASLVNAPTHDDDIQSAPEAVEQELAAEGVVKRFGDTLDELDRLIRSENIATERKRYDETAGELMAINVVRGFDQQLNLLQGDFRPANANAKNRRIVQWTSMAVAACIGVFLVVALAGGAYLNWQADRYFDKSVALYKDVFPKQRRVRNPVKQMKRQLSGSSVGASVSEFLPLLDAASRSLTSLQEQNSQQASIQQLRYDMQRGNIAIDIHIDNIDQLESYKDLLTEAGFNVDILSANQDGDIVKGRIQIGRT